MMYKIIGYYICEKIKVPQWLDEKHDIMVSVSGCFGGVHPELSNCYFINNRTQERKEYKRNWNIDDDKAKQLQNEIGELFQRRLAMDGRFICLSDARYFYETYFSRGNCLIVSLSTTEEYYESLTSDLLENSNSVNDFFTNDIDENDLLGFDILGWDISGFHSFLCNSLHKVLPAARFNSYGVLENEFHEVKEFAEQIRDMGEPVEWIPCRIGKCK